jgi:Cu2+-exporting ATPase
LHQLIFKSSDALQLAAKASIFVLDFNGTLTEGTPEVKAFELNSTGFDKMHVLNILNAFESKMLSERPGQQIGLAIQKYARENLLGTQIPDVHLDALTWCTGGASVKLNQQTWYLGNNQLLQDLNIQFDEMNGQRHYLLVQESEAAELNIIAIIDIQDKLRPDAVRLVKDLQHLKKKVKICTGADEFTVQRILEELNIPETDIHANCSYEQKPQYIKTLREKHPKEIIAMIGDGANDKPALEASDLKIWIKNTKLPEVYQQTLCEIANIEIHGEKLQDISMAFAIAEQTVNLIYQNLALSFIYNFIVLSVACGGLLYVGMSLPPAMGVCLMIIQSALLALNTYRVLLKPLEPILSEESSSFILQTAKA